jgi:catechol 2,3-dioxygenase-like lactoylglutathione lyase family enzyme
MPPAKLEHVNITVANNATSAQKLIDIFGWHIRWQGRTYTGGHSIHVGTDTQFIVLYSPPSDENHETHSKKGLLNHICVEVDDLDATEARVTAAGFTPYDHGDYEPGRRFYYFADDGVEYEVVSYR